MYQLAIQISCPEPRGEGGGVEPRRSRTYRLFRAFDEASGAAKVAAATDIIAHLRKDCVPGDRRLQSHLDRLAALKVLVDEAHLDELDAEMASLRTMVSYGEHHEQLLRDDPQQSLQENRDAG